jgi:hypothetical protein
MTDKVYFVYLEGPHGPEPQKWYGMPTTGTNHPGQKTKELCYSRELDELEQEMSIRRLMAMFPPPRI